MANPEPETLKKLDYNASFNDWRTELEPVLVENQVNYVLTEPKPSEPTATTPQNDIARHRKWLLDDFTARQLILGALHDRVYVYFHRHETAKSLMEALAVDFTPSMSRRWVKFRRYMDHKMAEDKFVTEHITEMATLASELEYKGVKVSEEMQTLMLMNSLPDSWEIGEDIVNIDVNGSDEMSLDNVCKRLIKKDQEQIKPNMYTTIKVSLDKDILEQIGKNIYFDLVDHDKVRSFCFPNHMSFNLFKEEASKEFGIPVQCQRFWRFMNRQNESCRPVFIYETETKTVGQLKHSSPKLKLFLEVEHGLDLRPIAPPIKTEEDILLFFKLYNPETEDLRYVGRLFVKLTDTPAGILSKLNEIAGYALNQEIDLYEEIMFKPKVMCEHVSKHDTFQVTQLEDGDIICFQKTISVENSEHFRYPNVPSFLESVRNREAPR